MYIHNAIIFVHNFYSVSCAEFEQFKVFLFLFPDLILTLTDKPKNNT